MKVRVDPITLQLAFQRLEFETGFDVGGLREDCERYRAALETIRVESSDSRARTRAYGALKG